MQLKKRVYAHHLDLIHRAIGRLQLLQASQLTFFRYYHPDSNRVALWGRIPQQAYENHEQRHEEAPRYNPEEKPPVQQPPAAQPQTSANLPAEQREKHWYDLDDKQKKGLEVCAVVSPYESIMLEILKCRLAAVSQQD